MFSQYLNSAEESGEISPIRHMPYDLISLQYVSEVCCINCVKEAYIECWRQFGLSIDQISFHLELPRSYSDLNTFVNKINHYRRALPRRHLPEEINLNIARYVTHGALELRRLLRFQRVRNFEDIFTDISAEKILAIKTIIFSQFFETTWSEILDWP